MTLVVPRRLDRKMREHAKDGYPDEVCGFLIGRESSTGERLVEEARRAPNSSQGSRGTRFEIHPRELLQAEESLDGTGHKILGFYHSHPDYPAAPSQTDEERAWPWYSYVVISVLGGKPLHVTSWVMNESTGSFEEETLLERR